MPIHGWVELGIGVVAAVAGFALLIKARQANESFFVMIGVVILVGGLGIGIGGPLKAEGDASTARQIIADVTKSHPDFHIQTLDLDNHTITYIRPGKGSDPYLCTASLLTLNGHFLVATVGAQCAPYND